MTLPSTSAAPPPVFSWLGDVREVRHPLSEPCPIWMRQHTVLSGPPPPQPTVPYPERHPYCELNLALEGKSLQYIGREKIKRAGGHLMLLGPGIPHYAELHEYPHRAVTVYFLPTLLFEMGPQGDGARILARFTVEQTIRDRVIVLPAKLRRQLERELAEMLTEFQRGGFGRELRLRALLVQILVAVLRWERARGREYAGQLAQADWARLEQALQYLQQHYTEPLYVAAVAKAAGMSVSRLQVLFRQVLGMSCVPYLMAYRISHAAALLSVPGARVTEVALAVGFETLSHFNTSFRQLMGLPPRDFVRQQGKTETNSRKTGGAIPARRRI